MFLSVSIPSQAQQVSALNLMSSSVLHLMCLCTVCVEQHTSCTILMLIHVHVHVCVLFWKCDVSQLLQSYSVDVIVLTIYIVLFFYAPLQIQ